MVGFGDLGTVLQFFSPVFVRTNGPGGLSTFSSRGFSASQTQVTWNGFPLNHAMLGVTDLSLIPVSGLSELVVGSGIGNTSIGEKGGGTIAIETTIPTSQLVAIASTGSFGMRGLGAESGVLLRDWRLGIHLSLDEAENNFNYRRREFSNEAGGFVEVEKERINNAQSSKTALFSINKKTTEEQFVSNFWIYDSENQIPGGISGQPSEAIQTDAFFRWMTMYKKRLGKHTVQVKSYLSKQQLDYVEPNSGLESLSNTQSLAADLEWSVSLHPKLQWITAAQWSRNSVASNEYPAEAFRNHSSLAIQPIWTPTAFAFVYAGARADYYSDFKEAFSAHAGVNLELWKERLFLKGQFASNYTTPTFNDLFWPALGNRDLVPETVLSAEASLEWIAESPAFDNSISFTLYRSQISNGIRWLPGSDGLSRPVNLEEVALHGIEVTELFTIQFSKLRLRGGATWLYNIAHLTKPRFDGDGAVNKQLIYTPEWQLKAHSYITWRYFSIGTLYQFADERFSSADHSSPFDPLSSFNTLDLIGSIAFKTGKTSHRVQGSIRNLSDQSYAIVRDYPMPGRHFMISITTTINTQ